MHEIWNKKTLSNKCSNMNKQRRVWDSLSLKGKQGAMTKVAQNPEAKGMVGDEHILDLCVPTVQ